MLAGLFGIKCKKKCSRSKIMPKKVLALSVRDYSELNGHCLPQSSPYQCCDALHIASHDRFALEAIFDKLKDLANKFRGRFACLGLK